MFVYVEMNCIWRAQGEVARGSSDCSHTHTHAHIRCWTTHVFMGRDRPPSSGIGIQVSVVRSEFQNGMQWLLEEKFCNLGTWISEVGKRYPYTGWFRRKGNLGGDSVGHCAKKVRMAMFVILNGYRDRDARFYTFKTFVNDNKGEIAVPFIFILI